MNVAVVYWSGTGNTEEMAKAVAAGIEKAGGKADVYTSATFSNAEMGKYEKIAFGCPAMGDEVLEEDEFDPMFTSLEPSLKGKKISLFGSYDWGDGLWMRDWEARSVSKGAVLVGKGLIVNMTPGQDEIADCEELGSELVRA